MTAHTSHSNPAGLGGRKSGVALVAAVIVVMAMTVMATAFVVVSTGSTRQLDRQTDLERLERGAESAIALGVDRLWGGYLTSQGGQAGSILTFRAYLTGMGVPPQAAGKTLANADRTDITGLLALPAGGNAVAGIGNVDIETVDLVRFDESGSTTVYLSATVAGSRGGGAGRNPMRQRVSHAFVTEGADWQGLEYALLANNVNCIMCHAEFGSADRFYNQDPALYGSFDRIKIGTLENILLRSGNDSIIGGSLYVRGQASNKDGTPITDWPGIGMFSTQYDVNGKVLEDAWGDANSVNFDPADADDPQPLENLYLDYSMDDEDMVDGFLPQSFPEPFPDDGGVDPATGNPYVGEAGNRVVDDGEFEAAVYGAVGAVSGGSIYVVDPGDVLSTQDRVDTAFSTGNETSLPSVTKGNVVLTGTEDNPIVLNGEVAIRGDLIIQGVIKGEGSFRVSGNVYLPSNLTYADGTVGGIDGAPRTYGTAADGTNNSLAISSGGSILVGDLFYMKKGGTPPTGFKEGSSNFVTSELSLFNRSEWSKTQQLLPGLADDMGNPASWTQKNPNYEPDYTPRYYSLTEGGDIPIFVPVISASGAAPEDGKGDDKKKKKKKKKKDDKKKGNAVWFDSASGSWQGKEHGNGFDGLVALQGDPNDSVLFDAAGAPKAVVQSLSTDGNWIPLNLLQSTLAASVAALPPGEPLNVDATLYTNNSIFGIIGKSSPAQGQMIVNGAIVAADVGLLIPGNGGTGLQLNYDTRGKSLLHLKSNDAITFRRKLVMAAASVHP